MFLFPLLVARDTVESDDKFKQALSSPSASDNVLSQLYPTGNAIC